MTTTATTCVPVLSLKDRILACSRCALRQGCNSPVTFSGPTQSKLLFLGESPGEQEEKPPHIPFQGTAGREFDNYLWQIFINREDVRVGNVVRCRPLGNKGPKPEEIAQCYPWLLEEVGECDPEVIVTMGTPAARALLGDVLIGDVHGQPKQVWVGGKSRWVFPVYHPAAGLHNSREMKTIQEDFQSLRDFLDGIGGRAKDQIETRYEVIDSPSMAVILNSELVAVGEFSMDTENTPDGKIWCASISASPGRAFVVWPEYLALLRPAIEQCKVTFHFVLHDLHILEQVGLAPKPENLGDTMVMAYLLSEPQGLKDLSRKLAGMEMMDYTDVVGTFHMELRQEYLKRAVNVEVPKPEGRRLSIITKIKKALKECTDAAGIKKRWDQWGDEEKAPIIKALEQDLPTGSLADVYKVDPERAIEYAARDADATERVKRIMVAEMKAWV